MTDQPANDYYGEELSFSEASEADDLFQELQADWDLPDWPPGFEPPPTAAAAGDLQAQGRVSPNKEESPQAGTVITSDYAGSPTDLTQQHLAHTNGLARTASALNCQQQHLPGEQEDKAGQAHSGSIVSPFSIHKKLASSVPLRTCSLPAKATRDQLLQRMALQNVHSLPEEVDAAVSSGDIANEMLPQLMENVTRKGRGGRQPAVDPRHDPEIDPKRAKRILANRESAARSKLKQKLLMETLKTRQDVLVTQRMTAQEELDLLRRMCRDLQAKNTELEARVKALEAPKQPMPKLEGSGGSGGSGGAAAALYAALDDKTLAGVSTLASMAVASRGQQQQQGTQGQQQQQGPQGQQQQGSQGQQQQGQGQQQLHQLLMQQHHHQQQHQNHQQQHQQQQPHHHQQHQQQQPHQHNHHQQHQQQQQLTPSHQHNQQQQVAFGSTGLTFCSPQDNSPIATLGQFAGGSGGGSGGSGSAGWMLSGFPSHTLSNAGGLSVGGLVLKPVPLHPAGTVGANNNNSSNSSDNNVFHGAGGGGGGNSILGTPLVDLFSPMRQQQQHQHQR